MCKASSGRTDSCMKHLTEGHHISIMCWRSFCLSKQVWEPPFNIRFFCWNLTPHQSRQVETEMSLRSIPRPLWNATAAAAWYSKAHWYGIAVFLTCNTSVKASVLSLASDIVGRGSLPGGTPPPPPTLANTWASCRQSLFLQGRMLDICMHWAWNHAKNATEVSLPYVEQHQESSDD